MSHKRLIEIINTTTMGMRKEAEIISIKKPVGGIQVVSINHEVKADDLNDKDLIKVDVFFFVVGVHKEQAEKHKEELLTELDKLDPAIWAGGPSYISAGAELGSQEFALLLFGLGEALQLWQVITPTSFGFKGKPAEEMAGTGMVMCSGYRSYKKPI